MKTSRWVVVVAALLGQTPATAEVVSSSRGHFELRHEATSTLTPDALWDRLVEPGSWWHPDHTYSGDASNLSLDPVAGGLWQEKWSGGSVAQGEVLYAVEGKTLRMNAPFGPLQGVGAYTIWTITITSEGDGSRVVFDEISTGPPTADMAELAGAVDFVKTQAMERLTTAN